MLQMTKLRPGLENQLSSLKQQVWRTTRGSSAPWGHHASILPEISPSVDLTLPVGIVGDFHQGSLGVEGGNVVLSYSWPTNFARFFAKGTERKKEEGQLGFIPGEGIIWTRQRDPVRRPWRPFV